MRDESMREMLCVRRGGLGDTLLMIPVLRAMRAQAPHARLTFAGVAEFGALFTRFGVADRVCATEDLALWGLRAGGHAAARAEDALRPYEWIVGDDPALAGLATAQRRVTVFDPCLDPRVQAPAAAQLLARAGLSGSSEVTLESRAHDRQPGADIVLHPGSGSSRKCWPRPALHELAASLAALAPLQIVLGPTELEQGAGAAWSSRRVTAPATALALADTLASARACVGHDSGPTHLAAALGVPTIALFRTTDPRVWAPVGPHVRVVAAAPPEGIAAVLRELSALAP